MNRWWIVTVGIGMSAAACGGSAGTGGHSGSTGTGGTGTGVTTTGTGGTGGGGATGGGGGATASSSSTGTGGGGAPADPCAGGLVGQASDATPPPDTSVMGYGFVEVDVSPQNEIVSLETTLLVGPEPPATGTLFLWPGLQPLPGGENYDVLDNGVLQPVLTWGPTCAPNAPSSPYAAWWVSAQYVNTYIMPTNPNYAAYNGCHGGTGMTVGVGDTLQMRMSLKGTSWTQTVTDTKTAASASYKLDMLGQTQQRAPFVIEEYSAAPVADVVFTSTVLTFALPEPLACQAIVRGQNDYFAAPVASLDGLRCCISRIILRAEGVPATTPNGP